MGDSVWSDFACASQTKGQLHTALVNPVHSYLFLGDSQMIEAAIRFAATLIVPSAGESSEDLDRAVKLGLADSHPDIVVIRPEGSTLRVVDAEAAIAAASTTPLEASSKVVIVPSVDVIEPNAIGKLLKVVEEPPASVHFVLLAETVTPEIVTIASRCFEIRFPQLSDSDLADYLSRYVTESGGDLDEQTLSGVVTAAAGNFERGIDLVEDPGLANRLNWWRQLSPTLDGRGSTIMELVDSYSAVIDQAISVVASRQERDLELLDEQIEQGTRAKGDRSTLVATHKREQRKVRTQELRLGLGVLARSYRDEVATAVVGSGDDQILVDIESDLAAVQEASENLVRNPNETLLLQNLLIKLDR